MEDMIKSNSGIFAFPFDAFLGSDESVGPASTGMSVTELETLRTTSDSTYAGKSSFEGGGSTVASATMDGKAQSLKSFSSSDSVRCINELDRIGPCTTIREVRV